AVAERPCPTRRARPPRPLPFRACTRHAMARFALPPEHATRPHGRAWRLRRWTVVVAGAGLLPSVGALGCAGAGATGLRLRRLGMAALRRPLASRRRGSDRSLGGGVAYRGRGTDSRPPGADLADRINNRVPDTALLAVGRLGVVAAIRTATALATGSRLALRSQAHAGRHVAAAFRGPESGAHTVAGDAGLPTAGRSRRHGRSGCRTSGRRR